MNLPGVRSSRNERTTSRGNERSRASRSDPPSQSPDQSPDQLRDQSSDRLWRPDPTWRRLYRVGGWAALVYVLLVLVPVTLVFVAPLPPTRGAALLDYIADHRAVYLTELVCFVGLAVPAMVVFGALSTALKGVDRSIAAIGGLFGVTSEVIALALGSSPQSLHGGLVVLATAYQDAEADAERAGLVSAAEALIATTNAVSWAGILTAAAILLLSLLMRREPSFGPMIGPLGIVTGAVGIVAEALRPMIGPGYLLYGLLLPAWFALVGWKLLHLEPDAQLPSSPGARSRREPVTAERR
ncbi:hypothetical protein LL946_08005 [Knoellia locipacati]|uniref:hypothetical protein n=1 Tax=Knoellia locipacati TaxID=882824 RepID=UPI00384BC1AA